MNRSEVIYFEILRDSIIYTHELWYPVWVWIFSCQTHQLHTVDDTSRPGYGISEFLHEFFYRGMKRDSLPVFQTPVWISPDMFQAFFSILSLQQDERTDDISWISSKIFEWDIMPRSNVSFSLWNFFLFVVFKIFISNKWLEFRMKITSWFVIKTSVRLAFHTGFEWSCIIIDSIWSIFRSNCSSVTDITFTS